MSPPRVYFVNRFYWPETPATAQLLTDLAEGLARSGFLVTIVTSANPGRGTQRESVRGVEIARVSRRNSRSRSLLGRVWQFLAFIRAARQLLSTVLRPGDIVVAMTDPPLIGAALDGIARRRGARPIHWVQDIFPEVVTAVSGKRLPRGVSAWRDRSWRNAALCVAPGEAMAAFIASRGASPERIRVCGNWAPAGLAPDVSKNWRQTHGLAGKFVLMYSGNLGRVHDFSAFVPLLQALSDLPDLVLVVAGGGAREDALRREVAAAGLSNVKFVGSAPREELGPLLSAADLHLIALKEGCEALVFPSKLYGIAAVARPALVFGPPRCEVGRKVEENGFGACFASSESAAAADFVRRLKGSADLRSEMSRAAADFARREGGLDRALSLWREYLQLVASAAPPHASP